MKENQKNLNYSTNVIPNITGDVNHVAQKIAITASHQKLNASYLEVNLL